MQNKNNEKIRYEILSKEEFYSFYEELNQKAFTTVHFDPKKAMGPEELAAMDRLLKSIENVYSLHIAAYDGDQVVGWSHSQQAIKTSLYTQVSAVLPEYRGRGIYTKMTRMTLREAKKEGFQIVRSSHGATNNAVIIAKLKLGFTIAGMSFDDVLGSRIELAYFFNEKRKKVLRFRTGESYPDEEVNKLLGLT